VDDVRVRQSRRDPRLVEKHRDERSVLVHRRKNAFDDHELLETGDALLNGEEELGHPPHGDLAKERVLAETPRHGLDERIPAAVGDGMLGGG
jgi:hypothetical protein